MTLDQFELARRRDRVVRLRGDRALPPDATLIIPVNAQADLERVVTVIDDVLAYAGPHRFELVLMVNNYPVGSPPPTAALTEAQIQVVCRPDVRTEGVRVAIAARLHGTRVATAPLTIHIDADCRVPNPTAFLNWYVAQFAHGAQAAYTAVGFYDLRGDLATRVRILAHHGARWCKRRLLRVPTIRGSNFAIGRDLLIELFDAGYLPADFSLGPVLRARKVHVAYSARPELTVLTSGRYFERGWRELARYLVYRLRYNLAMLRVRAGAINPDHQQANTNRPYQIHRDEELSPGQPSLSTASPVNEKPTV